MTLLARALTLRADTTTGTLARVAQTHPRLSYDVLAHPHAPTDVRPGTGDVADLHAVLHAPTTTAAGRRHLLTNLHRDAVDFYVSEYTDAHPDAVNHPTDAPTAAWVATAHLAHPDVRDDIHLAAVQAALTGAHHLPDDDREALITHATRHGAHLTDLAHVVHQASRRRIGRPTPATQASGDRIVAELTHYAQLHTRGIDTHTARIAAIADSGLLPATKIRRAVDPDLAGTLLTCHGTRDITRAILETRELTHTDAAYRALHRVDPHSDHRALRDHHEMPAARPGTRYSHAQRATTPGRQAAPASPNTLRDALAADPGALTDLADHLLRQAHQTAPLSSSSSAWVLNPDTAGLTPTITHLPWTPHCPARTGHV